MLPKAEEWRVPESERMMSLSRGSLLSISSSSSSSPSLSCGLQPFAAHSSCSCASVSSASTEPLRLWHASQRLKTRFCSQNKIWRKPQPFSKCKLRSNPTCSLACPAFWADSDALLKLWFTSVKSQPLSSWAAAMFSHVLQSCHKREPSLCCKKM